MGCLVIRRIGVAAFLYGGFALSTPGDAAAQSVTALGPRAGVLEEPFTTIAGVYELPDGRVLVSDSRERTIRVIDFSRGTALAVSREGSGPVEYRTPGRFFAWTGDSVVMYDPGLTRLLVFDRTGTPRRSVDLMQELSFVDAGQRPSRGDIRFIDVAGRVYAQSTAIPQVAAGGSPSDSAPVVRHDIAGKSSDTLALVRLSGLVQRPTANGYSINLGALANPFRTQDAWIAFPDGRVAFVRSAPYGAEWLDAAGRWVRGPGISYDRIPVRAADRETIAKEGVSIGGRQTPIDAALLTDLPDSKPAFDHRSVIADHVRATVWVQRFRPAGDTIPIYDVLDTTGRLTTRVRVAPRSRVVGFGRTHIYVARTDSDDLQWLERVGRP